MYKAYIYSVLIALLGFFPAKAEQKPLKELADTIRTNSGKTYVVINKEAYTPVKEDSLMSGEDLFLYDEPRMADTMRDNGKIYVVVLVLATIFAGIIAYLIYMNRKITRLENETKK